MLSLREEYQSKLEAILPTLGPSVMLPEHANMVSSVTAKVKVLDFRPAYWRRNLESQVRFSAAVDEIHRLGTYCYVELSAFNGWVNLGLLGG
jgi:acyl transferase domain-containing protein